MDMEEEFAMII